MRKEDIHKASNLGIARRRFIKGVGTAGGAAILAGCGGQEAGDDEEGDGGNRHEAGSGIEAGEEELAQIQELAWITNQDLPVLPLMEKLAQSFQTTDDWEVPGSDSTDLMYYWPTEWLPRFGQWGATGDDDTLTLTQWAVPEDSQYNPWNGVEYAEPRRMLFDRFMAYNIVDAEYEGYAISDWEIDGESITLTVRDGLTWHDGEDVVAQDVVNQLKLDMYSGGTLRDFVDDASSSVEAVDEQTVELTLSEPVNSEIVLGLLQPTRLVAKDSEYGEYVERLDDADGDDEEVEIYGELTDWAVDEPIGCGPFQYEEADSQRTLLTKFEDHPDADNIDFEQVENRHMPSNDARWSALQNDEIDGDATLFMPQNQVNQLPDHVQIAEIPRHWGMGLIFNYEDEHFGQREVRQAIAHVIQRDLVAENSGAGTGSKLGVKYPSGITGDFTNRVEDEWLDGVVDEFEPYDHDEGRAEELLEEAGYAKENDVWVDGNGDPIEIPIKVPSGFSDWVSAVETVVDQLRQFGFESEMLTRDVGTYFGQDFPDGDFVAGVEGWANYDQAYPYYHFDHLYTGGEGSIQAAANFPDEFEVAPLHDEVRDGDAIDPTEIIDELARTGTEESDE
ncbi:ABC transporter substrate-binding protein [Natronococcus sp. JC468]|uniref:ABC transporter substrate-binding protein n=1 Tax=Natronococcus sp. JC468 TaxID=1961921 RepID=UPI00143A4BF2|nr:ABC transporter substrate-binding protein [Natronococcus sp. JC468]NKE36446.1 ABC transporter substrate-binding protein [Natronococcus sp. JC468]